MATAAATRKRLVDFYAHYNPNQLNKVDDILHAYLGEEEQLFSDLVHQYGPEPQPASASARPATSAMSTVSEGYGGEVSSQPAQYNRFSSPGGDAQRQYRTPWYDEDDRPSEGHWQRAGTEADPMHRVRVAVAQDPTSYHVSSIPRSGPGAAALPSPSSDRRLRSGTTIALSPRNSVIVDEGEPRRRAERLYHQAVDHVLDRERWHGRQTLDNVAAYQAHIRERAQHSRGTYAYDERLGFATAPRSTDRHPDRAAMGEKHLPGEYHGYAEHTAIQARGIGATGASPEGGTYVRSVLQNVRWRPSDDDDAQPAVINQRVGGAGWVAAALACCAQHGFVSLPLARSHITGNGGAEERFFAPYDPAIPPSIVRVNPNFPATFLHVDPAACRMAQSMGRTGSELHRGGTTEGSPAPSDPTRHDPGSWVSQLALSPLHISVGPRAGVAGAPAPPPPTERVLYPQQATTRDATLASLGAEPYLPPKWSSAIDDALGPSKSPSRGATEWGSVAPMDDAASPPRLVADVVAGEDVGASSSAAPFSSSPNGQRRVAWSS